MVSRQSYETLTCSRWTGTTVNFRLCSLRWNSYPVLWILIRRFFSTNRMPSTKMIRFLNGKQLDYETYRDTRLTAEHRSKTFEQPIKSDSPNLSSVKPPRTCDATRVYTGTGRPPMHLKRFTLRKWKMCLDAFKRLNKSDTGWGSY